MIHLETHFRLKRGGAVEVGVGGWPGHKAGTVSADRVSSGGLPVCYADFSELRKSMHEFSTLQETFEAARGGGFIES